ncbi:hypothetical protein AVEN_22525-1 [Araneus ventricosus]|uniref:Uncharacterized protein n=1 Tax=Araneus ventricosus TaxID=182803 RepID=A0A4Y2L892_ARAVE|nr:hypothetical protein AVEN_22525-1 [Araneus ventricosus]
MQTCFPRFFHLLIIKEKKSELTYSEQKKRLQLVESTHERVVMHPIAAGKLCEELNLSEFPPLSQTKKGNLTKQRAERKSQEKACASFDGPTFCVPVRMRLASVIDHGINLQGRHNKKFKEKHLLFIKGTGKHGVEMNSMIRNNKGKSVDF